MHFEPFLDGLLAEFIDDGGELAKKKLVTNSVKVTWTSIALFLPSILLPFYSLGHTGPCWPIDMFL